MGNCVASCRQRITKHNKVLQVVKMDGKIIEFKSPILVKDMLVNLSSGFGFGLSKEAKQQHLPQNYELKLGQVYYVVPSSVASPIADKDQTAGGVKRIKVVITKQQLEQLLTKKVSAQDFVFNGDKKIWSLHTPATYWMPKLDSIPEECE